jgi:hypothetical protein
MKTMRTTTHKDEDIPATENMFSGLYLSGIVFKRIKRTVPVNNPTTEIVTYTVADNNDRYYYVDDYSPDTYYEVGENVQIPVYIKAYKKKSGDASYSLNVLKPFRASSLGRGEEF